MLKGRKMFTTTLKKELYDILRNMSKATGIPMTRQMCIRDRKDTKSKSKNTILLVQSARNTP